MLITHKKLLQTEESFEKVFIKYESLFEGLEDSKSFQNIIRMLVNILREFFFHLN